MAEAIRTAKESIENIMSEYGELIGLLVGGAIGGVVAYFIRKSETATIIAGTLIGASVGYFVGKKYKGARY
jgi:hypothetical protein